MDFRDEGQLTVRELLELLKEQPEDALVWTEGCDCWGAADRVKYDQSKNEVVIGRTDGWPGRRGRKVFYAGGRSGDYTLPLRSSEINKA